MPNPKNIYFELANINIDRILRYGVPWHLMNYPKDYKGRYVRIPSPLKRESRSFSTPNFIKAHKSFIAWFQRKTGISNYGMIWIAFLEGIIISLILMKITSP